MVQELVQTHYPYVYLRHKTYYFRLVIPSHIRELSPDLPREIKRSLRTDSLTDAISMVSVKLPLIRLLKSCSNHQSILVICRKIADFGKEIADWVTSKLVSYADTRHEENDRVIQPIRYSPALKLDKAWGEFCQWKSSWSEKQAKANQRMFDNMRLFLGNVDVSGITKNDLRDALKGVAGLPQRNKKNYKGLPLVKLKNMSIPEEDRVASKYVQDHLKLFQSFLSTYLKLERGVFLISPTEGLKWDFEYKRFGALTDAEVRGVIGRLEVKPEWFRWFTLLALYSGARRSEIAGLSKEHIRFCADTGRYYFVIRDGKTRAARRSVPIHKNLIDAGFLEWVDTNESRLFDTAYHNLNRVTDLFGTILDRKVNDFGERLVFHSLRHTFITKSRAAGNIDVLVQQVVGHEKNGAGQTDKYTHTFQLKDVLKVVDLVEYQ